MLGEGRGLDRLVLGSKLGPVDRSMLYCVSLKVRPYRLKFFFAYKRNKANLDQFHMCFTISL